jgi:hypothetical protein
MGQMRRNASSSDYRPHGGRPVKGCRSLKNCAVAGLALKGDREVKVMAPMDMTADEIARVQKWFELTFFIDLPRSENKQPKKQ